MKITSKICFQAVSFAQIYKVVTSTAEHKLFADSTMRIKSTRSLLSWLAARGVQLSYSKHTRVLFCISSWKAGIVSLIIINNRSFARAESDVIQRFAPKKYEPKFNSLFVGDRNYHRHEL